MATPTPIPPPRKHRGVKLPSRRKVDNTQSTKKDSTALYNSKTVKITATHYKIPQKWSETFSVFPYWHNDFTNNMVLVSEEGFPKDAFDKKDSTAIINGTPCGIKRVSEIHAGQLSIPPFFQQPDECNSYNIVFEKREIVIAQSANITITKCFPDYKLLNCDPLFISKTTLESEIAKSTKESPIIEGQSYCCELKAKYPQRGTGYLETGIHVIFKVTNIMPEYKNNTITFFSQSEKGTTLTIHLDLPGIKICSKNKPIAYACHSNYMDGHNGITLSREHYNNLHLSSCTRPVIAVNGMAFLVLGTNNDGRGEEATFHFNISTANKLSKTGQYKRHFDVEYCILNPDFPVAVSMQVVVNRFKDDDDDDDEKTETDRLPEAKNLEEPIRAALANFPLQKGKIFQVPFKDSDDGQKLFEVTIIQVSGTSDASPHKDTGEQQGPEVYWLSDKTSINMSHSPAAESCSSDTFEKPIADQLTEAVAGIEDEVEKIIKDVVIPVISFPEDEHANLPPMGIILHGPTGTGKTLLAQTLAKILSERSQAESVPVKLIKGPELLGSFVGKSEENVRNLFTPAEKDYERCGKHSPLHIIIIDEMDALLSSRHSNEIGRSPTYNNVVHQFLSCTTEYEKQGNILFIGTTNDLKSIDNAIKRSGRFGNHYEISNPDLSSRIKILKLHAKKTSASVNISDSEYMTIAQKTSGRNGAFLESLIKEAKALATNQQYEIKKLTIGDIKKMRTEQVEINSSLILKALNKLNSTVAVDDILNEYLPVEGIFHKLECQGFVEHLSPASVESENPSLYEQNMTPSTEIKKTGSSKGENISCYMKRVLQSGKGPAGIILIEGGKRTGKSHVVHHLIKGAEANHVSIIKLNDLEDSDAVQKISDKLKESRLHERAIIVIEHFNLLFDDTVPFRSNKHILANAISSDLKLKDNSRVCIITSCKHLPGDSLPNLTINKKLQLRELTETDMIRILQGMNTKDIDINKIVSIFKKKIAVGDFISIINPCMSSSEEEVNWDLDALKSDMQDFEDKSYEDYHMYI